MMSGALDPSDDWVPWDLDSHDESLQDFCPEIPSDDSDEWEDIESSPPPQLFGEDGAIQYEGWLISTMRAEIIRVLTALDPMMDVISRKDGVYYSVRGSVIGIRKSRVTIPEEHALEIVRAMNDYSFNGPSMEGLPGTLGPKVVGRDSPDEADIESAARAVEMHGADPDRVILPMGRVGGVKHPHVPQEGTSRVDWFPVSKNTLESRVVPDMSKLGITQFMSPKTFGGLRRLLRWSTSARGIAWIRAKMKIGSCLEGILEKGGGVLTPPERYSMYRRVFASRTREAADAVSGLLHWSNLGADHERSAASYLRSRISRRYHFDFVRIRDSGWPPDNFQGVSETMFLID